MLPQRESQRDQEPSKRRRINPLLCELIEAHRKACREEVVEALHACGLRQSGGPIFGVEFVAIDAHHYVPEAGGKAAVILPYFSNGSLLDLVAVGLGTRACRTRAGICTALGEEWLDDARMFQRAVRLYSDPLTWLAHGRRGVVIVDWRAARHVLADIPAVTVDSDIMKARLDKALQKPANVPRIFVMRSEKQAAARTTNLAGGILPGDCIVT